MFKEIKNKELIKRLLAILKVRDVIDSAAALEIIVTSLAAILKSTNMPDISTLIKLTNFAPLKSLASLPQKDIFVLEELVTHKQETLALEDIFESQIKVARLIAPANRKRLAAYYTKPIGLRLMALLALEYAKRYERPLILSDPFLGSGLTLSEAIKELPPSHINKIWGIEPHPLSALVAYSAVAHALKGEYQKAKIIVGDAFKMVYQTPTSQSLLSYTESYTELSKEMVPKANVILTNPPFTRWEILDKDYRVFLTKFVQKLGYDKYVKRRQQNLQLISLFLMDYLLEEDGLLVSVLPVSTFYTLYGEAAKALLKDKYWIQAMVDFFEPSFSIDSGFKELVLIANKRKTDFETAFLTIDSYDLNLLEELSNIFKGARLTNSRLNWVNISKVPYPWHMNWLTLFGQNPLRELITKIFAQAAKRGVVATWSDAFNEKRIVRGIEMYGPEFFLIPNKYWRIVAENAEEILIKNNDTEMELHIDREFITPALRKPELYVDCIIPLVKHYFFSIPPKNESELPPDIAEYIRWGKLHSTAKPAVRAFGRYWYSHVNRQINVKKPFGRIFLPDKIDPSFSKRGVFACYTQEPLTASKNFYISTFNDDLKDKALALWFNSSLFIAYFIVASRKISERWTRFLEEDYLRMPVINVNLLDKHALQELANNLDKMAERKLEPLVFQLWEDFRLEMDKTLFEIIGIEDSTILRELYSLLKNVLCC